MSNQDQEQHEGPTGGTARLTVAERVRIRFLITLEQAAARLRAEHGLEATTAELDQLMSTTPACRCGSKYERTWCVWTGCVGHLAGYVRTHLRRESLAP